MPLPELSLEGKRSRAQELYALLRKAIFTGVLKPGERLVEEALAANAKISRTPVREALRKLHVEGLVQDTGRGMIVAVPTSDELAELCAVREVLEGMAARLAAGSASELELLALQGLMDEQRKATGEANVTRLVSLNHSFHEVIWQAARNRYLAQQLATLRGSIERLQGTTLALEQRRHKALTEHEAIVRAILERDPARAEAQVREHFRNAEAARLMLRYQGDPERWET